MIIFSSKIMINIDLIAVFLEVINNISAWEIELYFLFIVIKSLMNLKKAEFELDDFAKIG